MPKIVYFAHDLSDAAVVRRVTMLKSSGAELVLLGFRRTDQPVPSIDGTPAIDLGQTFEGRLATRAGQVLRWSLQARRWASIIKGADVIIARNLEMCTIALAARSGARSRARLVYECLDIHGALLGQGMPTRLLKAWEKRILRKSSALIVSSPGFIKNYFTKLGVRLPQIILAENKRLLPPGPAQRPSGKVVSGRPWRIGWFGLLRCVKSFEILFNLAQRRPDLIDVSMRGLPTEPLQILIDKNSLSNFRFHGKYTQDQLSEIYTACDFTWAVDYTESGRNSDWLLPNRIYEGGYFGLPALALSRTEIAQWLDDQRAGLLFDDPSSQLEAMLENLEMGRYEELASDVMSIPTGCLAWTDEELSKFLEQILTPDPLAQKDIAQARGF